MSHKKWHQWVIFVAVPLLLNQFSKSLGEIESIRKDEDNESIRDLLRPFLLKWELFKVGMSRMQNLKFLHSVFLTYQIGTALIWKRLKLQIRGWSLYLLLFELISDLINFVKFNSLVHSLCSMKHAVTFIAFFWFCKIHHMGILLHCRLVKNFYHKKMFSFLASFWHIVWPCSLNYMGVIIIIWEECPCSDRTYACGVIFIIF